MCIIILLQQGKGAEVGAVFGGSSQTVFGASGAGNALTKATWALAIIFFASSIFLALASARRVTGSIFGSGGGVQPQSRRSGRQCDGADGAGKAGPDDGAGDAGRSS